MFEKYIEEKRGNFDLKKKSKKKKCLFEKDIEEKIFDIEIKMQKMLLRRDWSEGRNLMEPEKEVKEKLKKMNEIEIKSKKYISQRKTTDRLTKTNKKKDIFENLLRNTN